MLLEEFPLPDEAVGLHVNIVEGLAAGKKGVIDALADDPHARSVLVEIHPHGEKVWIEVEHLEETPNTELYRDRAEVMDTLTRLANGVMRKARAEVEHIVAQTKRGTIYVSYNSVTHLYEITTNGGRWTATGRAGETRKNLINLFDVQEEAGEPS